jgi:hypothetical protein
MNVSSKSNTISKAVQARITKVVGNCEERQIEMA